ncbi:glycosyltransferase family 4 protein [Kineococcus rhizosphaerae]|uniref:Glycosyltransferase involved in cell wall biosynthesis n=1 Tax=Kineococcus rhizosphaerae TaxID=559628 RepID=A0A2T0R4G2_9ACTN|nr:glycosyltransferase family 4 protein [Kineococcus rhizosphaerae]PRY15257.1 glycosyltransferase involved in cell wall biosynthesis [Kineococcus rhizosphaerae]
MNDRLPAVFVSTSSIVWGAELSLLTTARHLADQGVEVGLLGQAPDLVDSWPGAAKRLATGTQFYLRLFEVAFRDRPQALVCCNNRLSMVFVPLRIVPRRWRPALVFDLHDYMPAPRGRRRMKWSTWFFDRVIAVSEFTTTQLHPDYTSVTVLPRPVELDPAAAGSATTIDLTADRPQVDRVGVVGRLDADKRIEVVVDAVATMPDVTLVLRGGSGLDETYTERLLEHAHAVLGERLVYEGRVPRDSAMQGLSCLVVANHEEALGRSVAEAQLAGVPVVVPDRGGASEMVDEGVTGRRFEAGSAQDLAGVLREVLDQESEVATMAKHAQDIAAERHSPREIAGRYLRAATSGSSSRPVRATFSVLADRLRNRGELAAGADADQRRFA